MINPRVRLIRPLREGAMGMVWVAEHLTLGTEVAVKFISAELMAEEPGIVERFQQEAQAAAQIKSPNVVQILDHGVTADAIPYIVMELLEGQSMSEWLELEHTMGLFETNVVVTQVARALAKAHALGIIHRDIKPHNIFLLDEDEDTTGVEDQLVKVLDFGIAKRTELPEGLTIPGMVIGTPGYMCPDQVLDGKEASAQTDLWALSVVAYQALTGKLPFYGNTIARLIGALVKCKFETPSALRDDIPEEIDQFFVRAFSRNPDERFSTAVELAIAFRDAAGVQPRNSEVLATGAVRAVTRKGGAEQDHKPSAADDSSASDASTDQPAKAPPVELEDASIEGGTREMAERWAAAPARSRTRRMPSLKLAAGLAVTGVAVGIALVAALRSVVVDPGKPTVSAAPKMTAQPTQPIIPEGDFTMGCVPEKNGGCPPAQLEPRRVRLSSFRIDPHEVTVAEYRRCADEEACTVDGLTFDALGCNWSERARDQHPVNCVTWKQAVAYCTWTGGELPTEAQWERAARGTDERSYPWGQEAPLCSHAVMTDQGGPGCGRTETWRVGSHPQGASPTGAFDMAGNVREWVGDWYDRRGPVDGARDPVGPPRGTEKVVRGGGWRDDAKKLLTFYRTALDPEERAVDVGFRCAHRVE